MSVTINGTTGVSLVQDGIVDSDAIASGAVTAAKLASGVGGKVLQVVQGTTSTELSISGTGANTTVLDTSLSVSITPSSASSKILVFVQQSKVIRTGTNPYGNISLLRNSTSISDLGNILYTNASGDFRLPSVSFSVLDSPATTSSITYKTTFSLGYSANGTIYVQQGSNTSFIQAMEISA